MCQPCARRRALGEYVHIVIFLLQRCILACLFICKAVPTHAWDGGGCSGLPTMLAILHVLLRQCLLLSHMFSTPLRTPLQYCKHLMYTLRVVAPPFHSNVAGKMSTYRHVTTPTKFVEVGVCLNCPRIHMRWLEHNKTGKLCTFPIVQLHRLWLWCTRVCKKCEPNG
jgi:hypothetical protein